MQYKIGAIIVTYNPEIKNLDLLIDNLVSQVDYVIVIDNGSNCKVTLNNKENKIKIIQLINNEGVAKAQNIGIDILIKNQYDYVCIFDQDSKINKNFISQMLDSYLDLSGKYQVGAIGPVCINEKSKGYYNVIMLNGIRYKKIPIKKDIKYTECSFVISSGSMIKTSCLKKIGLMREDFFIDSIDIEWCFRANFFGFKNFTINDIKMEHQIGEGDSKLLGKNIFNHKDFRLYYMVRNQIRMLFIKTVPIGFKIRYCLLFVPNIFINLIVRDNKKEYLKNLLLAINDSRKNKSKL